MCGLTASASGCIIVSLMSVYHNSDIAPGSRAVPLVSAASIPEKSSILRKRRVTGALANQPEIRHSAISLIRSSVDTSLE